MQTIQTHLTILENQIEKKVLVNKIISQKENIRLTKYEVAK